MAARVKLFKPFVVTGPFLRALDVFYVGMEEMLGLTAEGKARIYEI